MSSTFHDRLEHLRELTHSRDGRLTASVVVDQRYAHYQHERLEMHHPRGGHAKYLEQPLYTHHADYLRDYARNVLLDGGVPALMRSAEHLSDQVQEHAPREWGDLMKSGHPRVMAGGSSEPDTGIVIRDRPPLVARLSVRELAAKSRAILRARLAAGLTVYFFRGGKLMVIPGRHEPHATRGRL